jgi:trans-aconitate methyltransferase
MMPTIDSARSTLDQIAGDVTDYYASALAQHGATPRGVDWSCKPTQELRFVQLLRLCSFRVALSLNDVGCGYGALRGFLHRRHRLAKIDYLGVDLSEAMVDSARSRWGHVPQTRFETAGASMRMADYSLASGLFNVRLHHSDADWEQWVAHTLQSLHTSSQLGFAVNFLAPAQPGEASPQALYRPAIEQWKSFCESELQSSVEPITGYGMREYTLLVRRR